MFNNYVIESKAFTVNLEFTEGKICKTCDRPLAWMVEKTREEIRRYCWKRCWGFKLRREGE